MLTEKFPRLENVFDHTDIEQLLALRIALKDIPPQTKDREFYQALALIHATGDQDLIRAFEDFTRTALRPEHADGTNSNGPAWVSIMSFAANNMTLYYDQTDMFDRINASENTPPLHPALEEPKKRLQAELERYCAGLGLSGYAEQWDAALRGNSRTLIYP